MRVFCASVATESNSFSPLRTDLADFHSCFYAPPGKHPEGPTLCSAVFPVLRKLAREGAIELIEGTATWAEPGGMINDSTWQSLRDEVLEQVAKAMPLDAVVLGLHGAMIAQSTLDPEGELLRMIRQRVGKDAAIGVTFDPHSHLSDERAAHADIITVFKEFPHTDFVRAAEDCVRLTLATASGDISPKIAVFDVKMIDVMPTSVEPMRGFVDQMLAMEARGDILSLSLIHGFMAGDSPNLGAKVIAISDGDIEAARSIAKDLGMQVFSYRGLTRSSFVDAQTALRRLSQRKPTSPVVLADVWDNPGGGVAGDSTLLLREAMHQGIRNIAVGTIWDPMAVKICTAAGLNGKLPLRFGGKTAAGGGAPIDAIVKVKNLVSDAYQSFGASRVPLGDCAVIEYDGIEVILNSNRAQSFSPDLFTNLGVEIETKTALIIKSTNHFYDAFAKISDQIVYVEIDGVYPNNPRQTDYRNLSRELWPIVEDPHK